MNPLFIITKNLILVKVCARVDRRAGWFRFQTTLQQEVSHRIRLDMNASGLGHAGTFVTQTTRRQLEPQNLDQSRILETSSL